MGLINSDFDKVGREKRKTIYLKKCEWKKSPFTLKTQDESGWYAYCQLGCMLSSNNFFQNQKPSWRYYIYIYIYTYLRGWDWNPCVEPVGGEHTPQESSQRVVPLLNKLRLTFSLLQETRNFSVQLVKNTQVQTKPVYMIQNVDILNNTHYQSPSKQPRKEPRKTTPKAFFF